MWNEGSKYSPAWLASLCATAHVTVIYLIRHFWSNILWSLFFIAQLNNNTFICLGSESFKNHEQINTFNDAWWQTRKNAKQHNKKERQIALLTTPTKWMCCRLASWGVTATLRANTRIWSSRMKCILSTSVDINVNLLWSLSGHHSSIYLCTLDPNLHHRSNTSQHCQFSYKANVVWL